MTFLCDFSSLESLRIRNKPNNGHLRKPTLYLSSGLLLISVPVRGSLLFWTLFRTKPLVYSFFFLLHNKGQKKKYWLSNCLTISKLLNRVSRMSICGAEHKLDEVCCLPQPTTHSLSALFSDSHGLFLTIILRESCIDPCTALVLGILY